MIGESDVVRRLKYYARETKGIYKDNKPTEKAILAIEALGVIRSLHYIIDQNANVGAVSYAQAHRFEKENKELMDLVYLQQKQVKIEQQETAELRNKLDEKIDKILLEKIGYDLITITDILQNHVPIVYEIITGGKMSKAHYSSDQVLSKYENNVQNLVCRAIKEFIEEKK